MKYLLATCFLIGRVFSGDRSCSVSLPSTDERSCDYGQSAASKSENRASQSTAYGAPQEVRRTSQHENFAQKPDKFSSYGSSHSITQSDYERAVNDAIDGKLETAIPVLREAAKAWNRDAVYVNLCAFLLNWGHKHEVIAGEKLYKEAEANCNKALDVNPNNSEANENLAAIKTSREIRNIKSYPTAGRFVGQRKKKPRAKGKVTMGFKEVYTEREEPLRIYPGKMDDGDLEFKLYNGSSINPRVLTLHLGEVYVEDDFLSEKELSGLISIIDWGLFDADTSSEKGPKGTAYYGTLLSMSSHFSAEERLLIAHIRERVVNRANDLKGLDTPNYSYLRGVRAHATAMLRYEKDGKHNVHHDNDFVNRCLSASIVLNDGFEGGEFNLHTTKNVKDRTLEGFPIIGSVKGRAGRLLLFLSRSMNSVSEVKSGVRDAMYVWMTCDVDAEYQLDDPLEIVDDRKVWKASA